MHRAGWGERVFCLCFRRLQKAAENMGFFCPRRVSRCLLVEHSQPQRGDLKVAWGEAPGNRAGHPIFIFRGAAPRMAFCPENGAYGRAPALYYPAWSIFFVRNDALDRERVFLFMFSRASESPRKHSPFSFPALRSPRLCVELFSWRVGQGRRPNWRARATASVRLAASSLR